MRYEFIVKDVPGEAAAELPELSRSPFPTGGISLFGPVRDQADIESLLARLTALGLVVVAMRRLPD